jgi:hypothetical protein
MLEMVAKELQDREEQHRMKFKDKKLAAIFPAPTVDYAVQKIMEGCGENPNRREFAGRNAGFVVNVVEQFRSALTDRGVLPASTLHKEEIENVEYALQELKKYFDSDEANKLNPKSSYIFAFFVKHQIRRLADIAKDIDQEYEIEREG